jgi:hypothetical protein
MFLLAACTTPKGASVTPIPYPTQVPTNIPPAPASPGESILWEGLQVTMDELEITGEYITEFGSTRVPPDGQKIVWVHVRLKNTGPVEMDIPIADHFSILYAAVELKPVYGHRQNHTDYTTLGPAIFTDQELDGWLRFDIPAAAELKDLRFVFIPESVQVGTSYNSPNYPYADNKPTYVWNCAL